MKNGFFMVVANNQHSQARATSRNVYLTVFFFEHIYPQKIVCNCFVVQARVNPPVSLETAFRYCEQMRTMMARLAAKLTRLVNQYFVEITP